MYPEVPQLSTDSLASWINHAAKPVLLDVRSLQEYSVSHLFGARHLSPDTQDLSALDDIPRDTPIVTYCSVGLRSSAMARLLQKAGFTRVVNLKGSIFAWANEGRPVYRNEKVVTQVHPYDALWGGLLQKKFHP